VPVPVPAAVGTRTVQCHMFFGRLLAPAQRRHCSSRKRSSTWKCNRTSPRRQSSASRSPRRVSSRIHVFILRITISCSLWRAASRLACSKVALRLKQEGKVVEARLARPRLGGARRAAAQRAAEAVRARHGATLAADSPAIPRRCSSAKSAALCAAPLRQPRDVGGESASPRRPFFRRRRIGVCPDRIPISADRIPISGECAGRRHCEAIVSPKNTGTHPAFRYPGPALPVMNRLLRLALLAGTRRPCPLRPRADDRRSRHVAAAPDDPA
jgi:hypothetical protein